MRFDYQDYIVGNALRPEENKEEVVVKMLSILSEYNLSMCEARWVFSAVLDAIETTNKVNLHNMKQK